MKFKRLSKNNDAVETVIAVILMVAITVILAAAIGATVFSQGPEKPAPMSQLKITPVNTTSNGDTAYAKFEHTGGAPIDFGKTGKTKVMLITSNGNSYDVKADELGLFKVGSEKVILLKDSEGTNIQIKPRETVNIKIIDVQSNQFICDAELTF
jgi:FlaG/FlaF family flagellin (archaellin)